jgi:hypothetical protein
MVTKGGRGVIQVDDGIMDIADKARIPKMLLISP